MGRVGPMTLSQQEFDAILADETKRIDGDLEWQNDEDHSPARGVPGQRHVRCRLSSVHQRVVANPKAGTLSYTLIHRGVGRIYAPGSRGRAPQSGLQSRGREAQAPLDGGLSRQAGVCPDRHHGPLDSAFGRLGAVLRGGEDRSRGRNGGSEDAGGVAAMSPRDVVFVHWSDSAVAFRVCAGRRRRRFAFGRR